MPVASSLLTGGVQTDVETGTNEDDTAHRPGMARMPVVGSLRTGGVQSDMLVLQRLTLEGACALTPKVVASQAMEVNSQMED
eukprot:1617645-Karenia_brevis.AAC.1